MANASEGAEGSVFFPRDPAHGLPPGGKLAAMGLIIFASLSGNLLLAFQVFKEKGLHRAPYFFLLDLCLADAARATVCFPFVWAAVSRGSVWPYEPLGCKIVAFLSVLSAFHTVFVLFLVSITRYIAVAHHRFYTKQVTMWTCVAVVCTAWTLSVAMAFPPVFDVGTYKFIREEDQCHFEHRYFKANDSLGFMLMFVVVIVATHVVYFKLVCFVYEHRRMRPEQLVPAVSHNWTFHGPGATGQAAANWIAGFGRGPTPPTLVGIRQNAASVQNKRLLGLDELKVEKRIGRMFYIIAIVFLLLWFPYIVACFLRVFVKGIALPGSYVAFSAWMTYAQAGVNPVVCYVTNKELRRSFWTSLTHCRKSASIPQEAYCVIGRPCE
ncbi:probable G protein-coupled receptor 85 [Lethenteron reissneri]|uniref:probable G protein-coupled receptor 85 n=1 Tax=Lethenteron reissneri TaxID=7753 RepID=UPI002AB67031|nr:probable G protein-coupled receptor 85 [Lethenteron reissneri]